MLIAVGVPSIVNLPETESKLCVIPGGFISHAISTLVAPNAVLKTIGVKGTSSQIVWLGWPLLGDISGLGVTVITPPFISGPEGEHPLLTVVTVYSISVTEL